MGELEAERVRIDHPVRRVEEMVTRQAHLLAEHGRAMPQVADRVAEDRMAPGPRRHRPVPLGERKLPKMCALKAQIHVPRIVAGADRRRRHRRAAAHAGGQEILAGAGGDSDEVELLGDHGVLSGRQPMEVGQPPLRRGPGERQAETDGADHQETRRPRDRRPKERSRDHQAQHEDDQRQGVVAQRRRAAESSRRDDQPAHRSRSDAEQPERHAGDGEARRRHVAPLGHQDAELRRHPDEARQEQQHQHDRHPGPPGGEAEDHVAGGEQQEGLKEEQTAGARAQPAAEREQVGVQRRPGHGLDAVHRLRIGQQAVVGHEARPGRPADEERRQRRDAGRDRPPRLPWPRLTGGPVLAPTRHGSDRPSEADSPAAMRIHQALPGARAHPRRTGLAGKATW
jgi:hypothetical protein